MQRQNKWSHNLHFFSNTATTFPRYCCDGNKMNKWDQCLYKVHFWHSNEVVSLTGHVVSEPECMAKVPEVRWEFHRGPRLQVDNFQGDPGWLDTSLTNVNVEARKRTLLGHDWNLAATASVGFHVQVYLCCYFSLRKTKWTKLGVLMRFVCCLFLFAIKLHAIMGFQGAVGVMINKDIWNCANATQTAGSQGSC